MGGDRPMSPIRVAMSYGVPRLCGGDASDARCAGCQYGVQWGTGFYDADAKEPAGNTPCGLLDWLRGQDLNL